MRLTLFGIVTYEIFLQFLYVLAPISVTLDDISSIPLLMDPYVLLHTGDATSRDISSMG